MSLSEHAISTLISYWHELMGNAPQAMREEARTVTETLLQNPSLRRLAENPLLLTMLLVVKHGAGRLPPDRVSLYNRAIEVLLDTWNIKGHDALNLKESIPQLACIAFEMMRNGKQTATENELLGILELARERVPQIRRYAKSSPDEFLKRVELRSNLLVEAGHQIEQTRTGGLSRCPRHLGPTLQGPESQNGDHRGLKRVRRELAGPEISSGHVGPQNAG